MALRKSILVRYALALSLLGALLFLPSSRAQQEPYLGLVQVVSGNPNAGAGTPGVANEFLVRLDTGSIYFYRGTPTSWQVVSNGLVSGVTSVACGANMSCTPSPITGAGTVAVTPTITLGGGVNDATITLNGTGVSGIGLDVTSEVSFSNNFACNGVVSAAISNTATSCTNNTINTQLLSNNTYATAGGDRKGIALNILAHSLRQSGANNVTSTGIAIDATGAPQIARGIEITASGASVENTAIDVIAGDSQLKTATSTDLTINTDGQAALFSTYSNGLGAVGNLWGGGGGQSFSGAGSGITGDNTSYGVQALNACTTCAGNVAIGFQALESDINGITTTAIGYGALNVATNSIDNTVIGYLAGSHLTTGTTNTSMGVESLSTCTTCADNAVYGMSAGQQLTTGFSNACLGPSTGCSTSGSFNLAAGYGAGISLTTGIGNVALGVNVMNSGAGVSGNANTGVGDAALTALTSGAGNSCLGDLTCQQITSGGENTCAGDSACRFGNVANSTAFGAFALQAQTAGFNVAIGYSAGSSITSGQGNLIAGYNSITGILGGGFNTVIGGGNTTLGITSGSFNTIVGAQISGLAAGLSNNVILADGQGNIREQIDSSGNVSLNGATSVHGNLLMVGAGNYVQLVDNANAASSRIRAYNANPNGALSGNVGDLTADTATPALWINTTGSTTWVKVGPTTTPAPGNPSALGGVDGSVTFDGSSTVLGLAPSSSVYTLTRDIMPSAITVNNGVTIKLANYAIFCSGTFTNNGTISNDGNAAIGTAGGTVTSAGRFSATLVGGTAGGGVGGASGVIPGVWYTNTTAGPGADGTSGQSNGGGGGSSVALGAGPSGGATTVSGLSAVDDASLKRGFSPTNSTLTWGSGGSAGKNGSGTSGGGGGAGGGMAMIHAKTFAGTGNIHARGGAGAQGTLVTTVGGGGGGGGGAGFVFITFSTGGGGQTIDANGGAGATAVGDGGKGGNGGSGNVFKVNLSGDGTAP